MREDTDLLKGLVDIAVGIPRYTYPMQVNSKRPEGEYAAVKFIEQSNPGTDNIDYINEGSDVVQITSGIRIMKYWVLFSRDDVEAEALPNCMYRPDVQDYLFLNKMGLMGVSKLDNETLALETNWELRTGYEVLFNVPRKVRTVLSTINAVEIKGSYHEASTVIDMEINVKEETQ